MTKRPHREQRVEALTEEATAEQPEAGARIPEVLAAQAEQLVLEARRGQARGPEAGDEGAGAGAGEALGEKPSSSRTDITPVWAKKPKKPEESPSAKGCSERNSRSVGAACSIGDRTRRLWTRLGAMRWLYHIRLADGSPLPALYAPDSLAREGFLHASFQGDVLESARLHFPADRALTVLRIDPRRLDARVEIAATPRGPMPHLHGAVPRDAIAEELSLAAIAGAPDRVVGTRMAFVAFDGMTLLDLVGIHDPLSRLASMGFDPTSSCAIVSATGPRVWAQGGAVLTVDAVRPPLDGFDVLVVPGGYGTRALELDASAIAWLQGFPANRLVASVCTGSLLLGAAGRLRGKRATTHHRELARLAEFEAIATDARVVDEGQLVTGGGVTCALDVGIHLVRRLADDATAAAIARQMDLPA